MVADKMVRTKWYGQNGKTDKMSLDKMVWTKWHGQNGMNKMLGLPIKSSINLSIPLALTI